jgi:Fur family ferric uptake transcriptional regulator
MQTSEEIRKRLKAEGLRVTPQRLLVFRILQESGEHLDAEAVHARGRKHDSDLSLATVYRTLNKLEEVGLVEQCHLARNHRRAYYAATGKEAHDHFVCLGCGRVIELHTSCLDQAARELSEHWSAVVTFARVYLEGYCAECAPQATLEAVEP